SWTLRTARTIWRALGKLARNRKKDCHRSGDTIPNSENLTMVTTELPETFDIRDVPFSLPE
ncbi:MAG: hypothetical protein WBX00_07205, partial [Isosphaeraceae bacterium]